MKRLILYAFFLLNIVAIVYFWYQSASSLFSVGFEASLLAIGRLSGLLGTVLLLTQFVLISRAPWIEKLFGFDRLTRLHRTNGLATFVLISAHIPLVTVGTAGLSGNNFLEQFRLFLTTYDHIWLAAIAYAVLVMTIILSITIARKYLNYERWYFFHLFNYSVAFLALFHQVNIGTTLNTGNGFLTYWYALYIFVFSNLILFRFVAPVYAYYKYRFRVDRVEEAAADTYSIYVTGRGLARFEYEPGQFAKWRFLGKGFWKEEHPFTISSEPNGESLRLTPKAVGDYTSRLGELKVGTPVMISGPFGRLTLGRAKKRKLLLIAGGIGITPLRAMLAEVAGNQDVILLYSAKKKSDIAFKSEIDDLAKKANVKVVYILSDETAAGYERGRINAEKLREFVPDVGKWEVYLVGPPAMMDAVEKALTDQGVPEGRIYTERFSFAD